MSVRRVHSRELRPGRWWYAVAGLIAVGGIVAGVALLVLGVSSGGKAIVRSVPPTTVFEAGQPKVVTLEAGDRQLLYVVDPDDATPYPGQTSHQPSPGVANPGQSTAGGRCTVTGEDGGTVTFSPYQGRRHPALADVGPQPLFRMHVSQPGAYKVTCGGPLDGGIFYAIGKESEVPAGGTARIFGGLLAGVGLPFLGLLVAGAVALVTGLRRGAHKNRLLRQGPVPDPDQPLS